MRFLDYLQERAIIIISQGIIILITLGIVILDRKNRMLTYNIIYWLILVILISISAIILDYLKKRKMWQELDKVKESDLIMFSTTEYSGEQKLFIKELKTREERHNKLSDELLSKHNDNIDFFSAWIHELKTPLAVLRLIIEVEDIKKREIEQELIRFDDILNKALFYLRGSSFEKDYVITEIDSNQFIKERIKAMSKLFISNKIEIRLGDNWFNVKSDSKWLGFIIDQLLQNAIKYSSPGKCIEIYMEKKDKIKLHIKDNGNGIPEQEISRIFDRSFTGKYVRENKTSTGLGLYLVKKLTDKMGHRIDVESTPGKGSTFSIVFPQENQFFKILT